jgi:hypothetical protein
MYQAINTPATRKSHNSEFFNQKVFVGSFNLTDRRVNKLVADERTLPARSDDS